MPTGQVRAGQLRSVHGVPRGRVCWRRIGHVLDAQPHPTPDAAAADTAAYTFPNAAANPGAHARPDTIPDAVPNGRAYARAHAADMRCRHLQVHWLHAVPSVCSRSIRRAARRKAVQVLPARALPN